MARQVQLEEQAAEIRQRLEALNEERRQRRKG